uniref:Uncharacterized protein n=1 Tax=Ixodes ricinus TaxID=34613 RepID=A0A6B0U7L1_IXORI
MMEGCPVWFPSFFCLFVVIFSLERKRQSMVSTVFAYIFCLFLRSILCCFIYSYHSTVHLATGNPFLYECPRYSCSVFIQFQ